MYIYICTHTYSAYIEAYVMIICYLIVQYV